MFTYSAWKEGEAVIYRQLEPYHLDFLDLKSTGNTLTQGEYLDSLMLQRMDVPSIAISENGRH